MSQQTTRPRVPDDLRREVYRRAEPGARSFAEALEDALDERD